MLLMRAFILSVLLIAAALSANAQTQAAPPAVSVGQIVEKVVTQSDPGQSYALYVPTSYKPDRAWPILYAFDARSNGKLVAERFRAGAEKYGFLVASSNNSASDGPNTPNLAAMRSMWSDTHARFSIDDKRVYAAGFSGTVRFACNLALSAPGSITGIIGAGAGFPFETKPTKDTPFVFFGTVGERDFNYYEVMDLDEQMTALGLPHRIELFPGTHEWMPEELATRALGWMELQAMKKGLRTKDPALVESLWTSWTSEMARAASAGSFDPDPVEAQRFYASLAADFEGLYKPEAVAEVRKKAETLAASDEYKKERKVRQERNQRDKDYVARAPKALASADLSQALTDLRIHELKKQADSQNHAESMSARRLLNTVLVQTSYYLPQMFKEQGQHDRAIFVLSIAAEIVPDSAEVWYELAAANARKGSKKKAIENLRKAVEKGWADLPRLEGEAAFASLRQDKGYQEVVAEIRRKPEGSGS
jgi:tetratricopeptide (TPR) repeat protein